MKLLNKLLHLHPPATMAYSFMTTFPAPRDSRVLEHFTKEYFEEVVRGLGAGDVEAVHEHKMEDGRLKLFVHMKNPTDTGRRLAAKLTDVETRQKEGEVNVWPTRLVHAQRRDGTDMYYQIFKTPTLAERSAKTTEHAAGAVKGKIAPRVVF